MMNAPRPGQRLVAVAVAARVAARALARIANPGAFFRDWLARPGGEPLVVRLRGGPVLRARRRTTDRWILSEVFLTDLYAPDARFRVQPGDRVVDVGAHVGYFTAYAASAHPDVRVASFEPAPESRERLHETLKLNGLESRVKVLPLAVAGSAGLRRLLVHDLPERNSLLEESPPEGDAIRARVDVETVDLGGALALSGFEACDLLKMDCEGAEYEILDAATDDDLRRFRRMVIEYHEGPGLPGGKAVLDRLRRAGFEAVEHPRLPYVYAIRTS